MTIIFYSTSSNVSEYNDSEIYNYPTLDDEWKRLEKKYPQHKFINVCEETRKLDTADEIAAAILKYAPDVAIAFSFWCKPYDWLSLDDALVAEKLRERNVKTICSSVEAAAICFDKSSTRNFLQNIGVEVPKGILVHHELYWCERSDHDVIKNVYKEYVYSEIRKMRFPVVVKDTTGMSSYGTEVLPTFNSVKAFLSSKKNNADKIVEEYIQGEHFGIEMYRTSDFKTDDVYIGSPFIFSLNRFGITSPKQSEKIGPVTNSKYHFDELNILLKKIIKGLNTSGIIQVDLVFSENKWYVIEINPRVSGISRLNAVQNNKSLYEMLASFALEEKQEQQSKLVCCFKMPLLNNEKLQILQTLEFVKNIYQIKNTKAKQEREKGYCEVIFESADNTMGQLLQNLDIIANTFPNDIEKVFIEKTKLLSTKA